MNVQTLAPCTGAQHGAVVPKQAIEKNNHRLHRRLLAICTLLSHVIALVNLIPLTLPLTLHNSRKRITLARMS